MRRLIDANLNRMNEGLRVLEDIARFLLDDATLSARLKSLRHQLTIDDASLKRDLLSARDSAQEEFAKLPDSGLESARFKEARFALYEIERELTARVLRREKRVSGLYLILDIDVLGDRDELDVAEKAIKGGAKVVQLRDKRRAKGQLLSRARELKALCARFNVLFIVNDYPDIAIACDADGLHVGPDDLPVSVARQLLPIDKILGRSARTLEVALQAQADGADYIAVGSLYPTASKTDTELVGLETLRQIKEAIALPIVAIGGINADNVADVAAAGADSVAVINAVLGAENVEEAARLLAQTMEVK
jgi:thiamine-phosphate pyrophosphorylase